MIIKLRKTYDNKIKRTASVNDFRKIKQKYPDTHEKVYFQWREHLLRNPDHISEYKNISEDLKFYILCAKYTSLFYMRTVSESNFLFVLRKEAYFMCQVTKKYRTKEFLQKCIDVQPDSISYFSNEDFYTLFDNDIDSLWKLIKSFKNLRNMICYFSKWNKPLPQYIQDYIIENCQKDSFSMLIGNQYDKWSKESWIKLLKLDGHNIFSYNNITGLLPDSEMIDIAINTSPIVSEFMCLKTNTIPQYDYWNTNKLIPILSMKNIHTAIKNHKEILFDKFMMIDYLTRKQKQSIINKNIDNLNENEVKNYSYLMTKDQLVFFKIKYGEIE